MSRLSVNLLPDLQGEKEREKSNLTGGERFIVLCGLIKLLAFRTSGLDLETIADLYPMEILQEKRN